MEVLTNSLQELKMKPSETVIVTDVGCNGNMADFLSSYGFHALHGRALPPAAGIKLANHHLNVIAIIGDGGCYGEGMQHLTNLMRGNHDITVLVHDNGLYSLTTGQASPTTPKGQATKSTPDGVVEEPINPIALALSNHATFVARTHAFKKDHLKDTIHQALTHQGFSFVDILQPCVTFNQPVIANWQKNLKVFTKKFKSKSQAWQLAAKENDWSLGVFWQEEKPAYHQQVKVVQSQPLSKQPVENIDITDLLKEFI